MRWLSQDLRFIRAIAGYVCSRLGIVASGLPWDVSWTPKTGLWIGSLASSADAGWARDGLKSEAASRAAFGMLVQRKPSEPSRNVII